MEVLNCAKPELRQRLSEVSSGAQKQLATASHFVVILARTDASYNSPYAEYMLKEIKGMPDDVFELTSAAYGNFQNNQRLLENPKRYSIGHPNRLILHSAI